MNSFSPAQRAAAIVLAAATLTALALLGNYARHYFFLFDDFALVELARTLTARQILSQPLIDYYRPLPFLLLRAETFLFGWDHPAGYLAINLLFHVVNAGLCGWLTWLLSSQRAPASAGAASVSAAGAPGAVGAEAVIAAGAAFVLVLASPWATEAFLWASGVFDLLATLGVLTALIGVRLTVQWPRQAMTGVALAAVGTLVAAFSKENAVVIPALAVVAVLVDRPLRTLLDKMTFAALIACSLPVLLYLAVRASLLGMLSGAYGELGSLWRQATLFWNIYTYARAQVWLPIWPASPPSSIDLVHVLRVTVGLLLMPLIALLLAVTRPRLLAAAIVAFLIATAPVCWFGLIADSTVAGRYAYLPEILLAIAMAVGLARACALTWTLPLPSPTTVLPLAVVLLYVMTSMWYQVDVWTGASGMAQRMMAQLEPYRGRRDVALELENMPYMFVEGPFVVKAYAFKFYRDDGQQPLPPVKAHRWTIKYAWNSQPLDATGIDPTSDYLDRPPTGLTEQTVRFRLTPEAPGR